MADFNSIALANAEKGYYVFPTNGKLPYEGFMWKDLSSNDPEVVAMWIVDSRYTGCMWAIDLTKSGKTVIDFDQHPDKPNGFETAKKLGFTTQADYSWPSMSGTGQHNWYDGVYKQANGLYAGIDRKSGEGAYVIAPYELPYPDDIYQPVPKEYTIERAKNELGIKYEGSVQQWLEEYWGMPTHPEVGELIADFAVKGISGNELVFKIIVKLVFMALEGKGGVPEALEQLEKLWMKSPHSSGDPKLEWDRALWRAIAANGGGIQEKSEEEEDSELIEKIAKRVEQKRVDREAQAIIDAETHQAGQTIDLDAPDEQSKHLIKDLIVEGGINVLFGNSNVGKSFMYMDMWASACIFKEWQGFSARPFKTLFVLGEGAYEFKKRLKVWCEYRGVNYDDIKKYAIVRDGGVISNAEERKIWKDIIDSEGVEAVIWDTWSATAGLEDEDKAPQVTKTINSVRELGYHLTHLFIHHPPLSKEGDEQQRMRGSGALNGRSDCVINLADDSDNFVSNSVKPADGTTWMRLSTRTEYGGKKRNGRKVLKQGLYFVERPYGLDEFGDQETSLVVDSVVDGMSPAIVRITNVLGNSTMTAKQFMDEWNHFYPFDNISDDTARRKLKEAMKAGRVAEAKDPNSSRGKVYTAIRSEPTVNWNAAVKTATISY